MNSAHIFVVPFFLQGIMNFSPSKVGMLIFPVSLSVMVAAPLGGRLSDRVGTRIPATLGLILTSFTILSFVFLEPGSREYQILWRQVLLGIGIGLFSPANNSAIIGSLPKKKVGLASSFLALGRNLGLAIGVAFAEMVITFGTATATSETTVSALSVGSIRDVWKLAFAIGLVATLLSWIRQKPSKSSEEK
jgi:MFS family permease